MRMFLSNERHVWRVVFLGYKNSYKTEVKSVAGTVCDRCESKILAWTPGRLCPEKIALIKYTVGQCAKEVLISQTSEEMLQH